MKISLAHLFRVLALALALAFAGSLTASAQTTPPAASEKELLEYLKKCPPGQVCEGRVSIPDSKSARSCKTGACGRSAWKARSSAGAAGS